jgi:uncharacterized membrane protein
MFGFIVGTLCLIGFISVYKHRHLRSFGGFGARRMLRKLDASPGQERIIRNALASVKQSAGSFRAQARTSSRALADLLRSPDVDTERLTDWFKDREQEFGDVRSSVVEALRDIHEVLDDHQRETLARCVERAPGWRSSWHKSGPYRSRSQELL